MASLSPVCCTIIVSACLQYRSARGMVYMMVNIINDWTITNDLSVSALNVITVLLGW